MARETISMDGKLARLLYLPEFGVEQHVLPFREGQIVAGRLQIELHTAHYPVFNRDEYGRVYAAFYNRPTATNNTSADPRLRQWIYENCEHRVAIKSAVVFESRDDFILALVSGLFLDARNEFRMSRRPISE